MYLMIPMHILVQTLLLHKLADVLHAGLTHTPYTGTDHIM